MDSRYLSGLGDKVPSYIRDAQHSQQQNDQGQQDHPCIVVMGLGGKPELLLDIQLVKQRGIWVIKRFSGGGTVVVDRNCIYTTIIGRNGDDQLVDSTSPSRPGTMPPYPREIMEWTATDVFGPTFAKMKALAMAQKKSESASFYLQFPDFELKENDYVLGGTHKVAGNAQAIVKTGFLHHTTFLWSYEPQNMKYLTMPAKRPDYRKDRSHSSFLIQLKDAYHNQLEMNAFFECLQAACEESFDVEQVSLDEALAVVTSAVGEGGIRTFFETKSRTRFVDLPLFD
jgi:lipoate-protein ligase A